MNLPKRAPTSAIPSIAVLREAPRLRSLLEYAAALTICLFVLGAVFDLGSDARRWPYAYRGDTMFYHLLAKNAVDSRAFLDVPRLGAPGTLNLRDVPTTDHSLHLLTLRILAANASSYPPVLNNFFLLGFPLVFLSALLVMRHVGVTWWTGVCASLLYAFAPFHMARGEHHLFLTAYWPVPLSVMMILWVGGEGLGASGAGGRVWRDRRMWASVTICLVLASTGLYYAFFASFFLLIACIMHAGRRRSWRGLWPGMALIALVAAGTLVNLLPSLSHFHEHGTVPVVQRVAHDADTYGLRIAQMLLPVRGHRLDVLEELRGAYIRRPSINENDDVSLGVVGALGFVGLLWWCLFRRPPVNGPNEPAATGLLHRLSVLNLAGVLFGTIGGFGSLVALFGLPQIRAYNRIAVFLGFFALLALALWVDGAARRHVVSRRRALALNAALGLLTVFALTDQISTDALPDYGRVRARFTSDAVFVEEIERHLPRGALVLQLPFVTFPESPAAHDMLDYDPLRGYLHSTHLRWSYGTIRGREGDAWLREITRQPADRLVETAAWAGFDGIYIDRNGLADRGVRIEKELRELLGDAPIYSPDEQLLLYSLTAYRTRLEESTPADQRQAKRAAVLNQPLAVWRNGFSDQEDDPALSWRWGGPVARMVLVNRAPGMQAVRLRMTVDPRGGLVTIDTPLLREPVRLGPSPSRVDWNVLLPPGEHAVHFAASAQRLYPPNDFRDLAFSVQDFSITSLQDSPSAGGGAVH